MSFQREFSSGCFALFFYRLNCKSRSIRGKSSLIGPRRLIRDVFFGHLISTNQEQSEQGISAIRHIGKNALPLAVKLCGAKDTWIKQQLAEWAERYDNDHWPKRFPIRIKPAWEKNFEGANIIWALGPLAAPAIPDLIQLLQSGNREIAESAMIALPGIGTNAVPPLLNLLDSANPEVRLRAAIVLGEHFGSQAHTAVPVLLDCLENQKLDSVTQIHAIYSLGFIKQDAPVIVPAFVRHIENETNNLLILSDYISTLRKFGTNAKPAVPLLVRILESKDNRTNYFSPPKASALVALETIDPQTAKPFVEKWKVSLTNAPFSNAVERSK